MNAESQLVVLNGTETDAGVVAAGVERAERDGATLVVLRVVTDAEYARERHSIAAFDARVGEGYTYTRDQAVSGAKVAAARAARAAIGDRDVAFEAVGRVGGRARTIRAVAAEYDCRTVLLASGSWLGRLFGGDRRFDRALGRGYDGRIVRVSPGPALLEPDVAVEPETPVRPA